MRVAHIDHINISSHRMAALISSLHTISLNLPKTNLFYISSDPTDSANSSFLNLKEHARVWLSQHLND